MNLYPLQFHPILKERIWGGSKLQSLLHKPIPTNHTGESWELSAVSGDVSVVSKGDLAGKSLTELIELAPVELLGSRVFKQFGNQFPLLFKYLDARQDLSIQVHPNDTLAKARHNSFGKTEMWYVMQADENARLIVGFKYPSNAKEYVSHLDSKTLVQLLNSETVTKGNVFFLETGTVHAIGAGLLVAEIQQTSDITYRLYDFDRVDAQGNTRELHVDLALDAINYETTDAKKTYSKSSNTANSVVDCPYFTTNFIPLDGALSIQKTGDSFTVYMVVDGEFSIKTLEETYRFELGDTVLIPAALKKYELVGNASILEIYIK